MTKLKDLPGFTENTDGAWIGDMHVTFGPMAKDTPVEEILAEVKIMRAAAEKNRIETDAAQKALEGTKFVAVPIDQLSDIYERFIRLTPLGQFDLTKEYSEEVTILKRQIFAQSDFGAVFAGQWLPQQVRSEIRARVLAETKSSATLGKD